MPAALRLFFVRLVEIYSRTRGVRGLITAGTSPAGRTVVGRLATRTVIGPAAAATSRFSIGRIFSALVNGVAIIDIARMVWEMFHPNEELPPNVRTTLEQSGLDPDSSVSDLDESGVANLLSALSVNSGDPGVARLLRDLAATPDRNVEDLIRESIAVDEAYAVEDAYRDLATSLNMRPAEVDRVVDAIEVILSAEPEDRFKAKSRIAAGRL